MCPALSGNQIDMDAVTTAPNTPAEKASAYTLSNSKSHFNASLDMALNILQHQEGSRAGSATPVNWLPSVDIETESVASTANEPSAYLAPDDLILDVAKLGIASDPSSCSFSSTTTAAAMDAAVHTSVVKPIREAKENVTVQCRVRARIPYPGGHFYLHLYHNDEDNKEHLAIVFGDDIRSTSLEAPQDGETELDRRIRGASTGPSRTAIEKMIAQRQAHGAQFASDPLEPAAAPDSQSAGFDSDPEDTFGAARVPIVDAPLVRIHSECFTGETVSSVRCDCGYQLAEAMRLIQQEGRGVIVYLRQEGRGIGLLEKLKAYNLQDMGHDTVDANLLLNHPADARTYGSARAILADLGISRLRLLTNNTDKIHQLRGHSTHLDIVCHVPMYPRWWDSTVDDESQLSYTRHLALKKDVMAEADRYLRTKAQRMGHMLNLDALHFAM
ncbi:GTP cyclohydrolase II [Dipsacomyces acuminosporus]|nr:GTP cyclohydrolase II [Dipsacomyces acuminosporus]